AADLRELRRAGPGARRPRTSAVRLRVRALELRSRPRRAVRRGRPPPRARDGSIGLPRDRRRAVGAARPRGVPVRASGGDAATRARRPRAVPGRHRPHPGRHHDRPRGVITGRGHTGAVPYDPASYLGCAAHYRYGRPAYSPGLEAVLTQQAGLDGNGRLLDVGCGPGVRTVRLAHLFERAVGLDPDAGMLAEGRRAAEEKAVMNIRWVQGLAEDL